MRPLRPTLVLVLAALLTAPPGGDRLAIPRHERAQAPVMALRSTRVLVSAREMRVIFPPDTSQAWGWPSTGGSNYGPLYYWGVSVDGIDGPRSIMLRVDHADTSARGFPGLRALVASGKTGICTPGFIMSCASPHVTARVEESRVVLTLRDPKLVGRLFGLRQDSVEVTHVRPDDPAYRPPVRVAVEYVAPRIPRPTAALRAEAARARRRYLASINWIRRGISGGYPSWGSIWLGVGDSIVTEVYEARCTHDVCSGPIEEFPGTVWMVDDTSVVRLARETPRPDSAGIQFLFRPRSDRRYLVARAKGRTTARVRLPATPADTMPFREPPPRTLEREVVVTNRAARVEIAPRPDTVRVEQSLNIRVRVLDADGRPLEGAPVAVTYGDASGVTLRTVTDTVTLVFDQPGSTAIVARFGTLADTVRVAVVGDPRR